MSLYEIIPLESENMLAEKSALHWTVTLRNKSSIRSPVFTPMKIADTKFYFEGWFQRNNERTINEETSLQITLRKLSETSIHSDLRFQFSVFVQYSDGSSYDEFKLGDSVNLEEFTEKMCINKNSKVYVSNWTHTVHQTKISSNLLTLKCWMTFSGHVISPAAHLNNIEALLDLRKYTKNFESLYQSSELSDVSIQVGEKTFKSHKCVLAAHSPVFKRMLDQEFQEAKTGVITISDFEPEVFESLLKFLYTGEVEVELCAGTMQLYTLADKYDVQILKQKCFKILTDSSLNEEQAYDVLQLAYQYNDDELIKATKQVLRNIIKKE